VEDGDGGTALAHHPVVHAALEHELGQPRQVARKFAQVRGDRPQIAERSSVPGEAARKVREDAPRSRENLNALSSAPSSVSQP